VDEKKFQSKPKCGIIRPISAMGETYPEKHWQEIADILDEVVKGAGFESNLVSNGSAVDVIQTRIVQNLYHYPLVICDVSGANANVMFELGLRLAFDKATISIKDRETGYNFDTSPIEHINYPRDLHYPSIIEFKHELKEKFLSTFEAQQGEGYSPFLKRFGGLVPRKLDEKEVSGREYIEAIFRKITDKMDDISIQLERQRLWIQKQEEAKQRISKRKEKLCCAFCGHCNVRESAPQTAKL